MSNNVQQIDLSLRNQVKNISSSPGIYMMLDAKGDVIYIGKAVNLKERVRSYLNIASWKDRPKLHFMMPKVKEIKTLVTRSENEALILEANLVNKYQPKYNVTLKDDKKFPWLMITYDEQYPRVVPIRDVAGFRRKYPKTKNKFFGPYSDSGAMWETYKVLKEGFQLRLRRKPLFKDRPCMNYHIGLCSGPCQRLIGYEDYHKLVGKVEDFLLGKYNTVMKDLKQEMNAYSKNLEYERAAKLRDTINKIEKILEKQVVVSDDILLTQDVFACSWENEKMILELLIIREGKIITVESFVVSLPKETNPESAFNDAIKQYYTRIKDESIPNEIVVQFKLAEKEEIEEWLSQRIAKRIIINCPKRGKKQELIALALQNARIALQRVLLLNSLNVKDNQEDLSEILYELQDKLSLKNPPIHIECFDISHLGGTGTVASMVCFINGKPDKNQYRKYKLKTVLNKIDDYQAMKEVITRRYSGLNINLPALIIVDGGKGQLSAVKETLEGLGIVIHLEKTVNKNGKQAVDLISLAKREEEIFKINKRGSILLSKDSKALFLLQRVRDEAHRFAISFQRDTRKDMFVSKLETVPDLGKAKIKKLMNYFGSLKNIQDADLKMFSNILGQKQKNAKEVLDKIKKL